MDHMRVDPDIRGKTASPFLECGMIVGVRKLYRIEKMVGGGGFGQIYRAVDTETRLVVAVKVEPKSSESGRLILELAILVELQTSPHIPRVFSSGQLVGYNFIIMQMLGANLADLRKGQRTRCFLVGTTCRIGIQVLECLRQVHSHGYIHRDIKPANICVGIGEHKRVIYLVDFGMARRIRLPDGTFRPERSYASFRGTIRYVSLNAHERKEQGFVDDIWSLFFSLLEMVEGLPWKNVVDADEVYMAKKQLLRGFQSRRMGRNFELFPQILERTSRTQTPDYDRLIEILKTCAGSCSELDEFEWDERDEEYK